jgi:hypothetical protein
MEHQKLLIRLRRITQQVHIGNKVFSCTIYSRRPKGYLAMQVFVNISSRGCFYSEELCLSAFTGLLELCGVPFLLRSQFLPGTRSDKPQFDNSAEVRCFTHERP